MTDEIKTKESVTAEIGQISDQLSEMMATMELIAAAVDNAFKEEENIDG